MAPDIKRNVLLRTLTTNIYTFKVIKTLNIIRTIIRKMIIIVKVIGYLAVSMRVKMGLGLLVVVVSNGTEGD